MCIPILCVAHDRGCLEEQEIYYDEIQLTPCHNIKSIGKLESLCKKIVKEFKRKNLVQGSVFLYIVDLSYRDNWWLLGNLLQGIRNFIWGMGLYLVIPAYIRNEPDAYIPMNTWFRVALLNRVQDILEIPQDRVPSTREKLRSFCVPKVIQDLKPFWQKSQGRQNVIEKIRNDSIHCYIPPKPIFWEKELPYILPMEQWRPFLEAIQSQKQPCSARQVHELTIYSSSKQEEQKKIFQNLLPKNTPQTILMYNSDLCYPLQDLLAEKAIHVMECTAFAEMFYFFLRISAQTEFFVED